MTRHGLGPPQLSLKEDPAGSAIRGHPDLHNRVLRDLCKNTCLTELSHLPYLADILDLH